MNWFTLFTVATLLILPALFYGIYTSSQVNSTFEYYANKVTRSGLSGAELAKKLLLDAGATDVDVVQINGKLTDCYDSRNKVIKLSSKTFNSCSVSALGVCAHEVGHAIQDHKGTLLYRIRQFCVPIFSFISRAYIPLIIIGIILSFGMYFETIGFYFVVASVVSYGASLMFYLITYPVELDASRRAIKLLRSNHIMDENELVGAKHVLSAASKTYLAALLTSLVYFLRFLSYAMMLTKKD